MALSHLCWGCILQFAHLAREAFFPLTYTANPSLQSAAAVLCLWRSLHHMQHRLFEQPPLCVQLFQLLKGWLSVFLLHELDSWFFWVLFFFLKPTIYKYFQKCWFKKAVMYSFTKLFGSSIPDVQEVNHLWAAFYKRWWNLVPFKC